MQSLIREVAYGTLAKRDRRTRHLAAARYFEALGDDELAGALATHYLAAHEASAEGAERDAIAVQARLSLRGAGERAAALGAHGQAVSYLRQAIAVTSDPLERAALLVLTAGSANPSGAMELAESSTREAIRIYSAAGNQVAALRAAALLGRTLVDAGKLHDAGPELEAALAQRGSDEDDEASAAVLAVLARVYMRLNEPDRSVTAADRALRVAERAGAKEIVVEALLNKGTSYTTLARTFEGGVLVQASVDLAEQLGLYEPQLRGLNNLAAGQFDDDPRQALATIRTSIALAEQMGQGGILNWQIGAGALFALSIGDDWDEPQRLLQESIARALTPHDKARAVAALALYRVTQGNDPKAAIAAAHSAAEGVDENQLFAAIAWAEALQAFLDGDHEVAFERARTGIELWHNFSVGLGPMMARAAAYSGRRAEFDAAKQRIEAVPSQRGVHGANRTWVAAVAAVLDGRDTEGARLFSEAGEMFGQVGFGVMQAGAYLDAVRLLPDDPAAATWAANARATFDRLEMKPYSRLLDAADKGVGSNTHKPTPRRTEVEVASEPA